ncbi:hypothetical protein GCM10027445_39320 [Amycolatopsis endophytica]|uniref:Uncharacterized protein n=1 Tax=Amycolatopsis endophytica TaxID=860233 RepID=A0A853B0Q4_9PSEU|nr:hypothetical protein [Amycolatopsis endophytica]NYI88296.1 hypothetical protein [Amycolatopsis endophytica]
MNPDDELGAELRRLFDDERLAVHAAPDAGDAILSGIRRRRRRRNALAVSGGVLTAAVLVSAGLLVASPDPAVHEAAPSTTAPRAPTTSAPGPVVVPPTFPSEPVPPPTSTGLPPSGVPVPPTSAPATQPPKSTSGRSSARPAPAAVAAVLGPTGYAALRLGMSFDDAKATGMLAGAGAAPAECTVYRLTEGTGSVASVTISPTGGVVVFTATGARSPENVGTGSTVTELRNAYPDLTAGAGNYSAATGSGAHYTFYVNSAETVVHWELVAAPGC